MTTTNTATAWRVACPEHQTGALPTEAKAEAALNLIERSGLCEYPLHTIEVRQPDGTWLARHLARRRGGGVRGNRHNGHPRDG